MRRINRLLENARVNYNLKVSDRRYSLSEMISESYKALYSCREDSKLRSLIEAHIRNIKDNPQESDSLSLDLNTIKAMVALNECSHCFDEEDLDDCDSNKTDSIHDEDVEEVDESKDDEDVEELEEADDEITQEELEELSKHLKEIRASKKMKESRKSIKVVKESKPPKKATRVVKESETNESAPVWSRYRIVDPDGETIDSYTDRKDAEDWVKQLYKDGDYKRGDLSIVDSQAKNESKSYDSLDLSNFKKNSESKAFVKTFKKLDSKLHEGTALTRQESISLYKAANSAMTHLSVELEHNPEFLSTFKESVSLLSTDVEKLLNSLKEGKAPSKATMKSLAKFSEALLREEDEVEDTPLEDEEDATTEEEQFDQEYADARVELHKELEANHADSEDPAVQDKLAQDTEEVVNLPGVTEEQAAELTGGEAPEGPAEESSEETDESIHDEDVEELKEKDKKEEEDLPDDFEDSEITDDELAELKKYLKEMRKIKKK